MGMCGKLRSLWSKDSGSVHSRLPETLLEVARQNKDRIRPKFQNDKNKIRQLAEGPRIRARSHNPEQRTSLGGGKNSVPRTTGFFTRRQEFTTPRTTGCFRRGKNSQSPEQPSSLKGARTHNPPNNELFQKGARIHSPPPNNGLP